MELSGCVRNARDGTVEVEARGPRSTLEKLVERLWKGPSFSRVTDVQVQWDSALGNFEGFDVSY